MTKQRWKEGREEKGQRNIYKKKKLGAKQTPVLAF